VSSTWWSVEVDCHDIKGQARFWCDVLGYHVVFESNDEVAIAKDEHTWPGLGFGPVPETKTVKNRLHIDLSPDDQEAEVSRIEGLGGRRIDIGQSDVRWIVMADREGNEFCVLTARDRSGGSEMASKWWSVVVDCHEIKGQARFWCDVLGYDIVFESNDEVAIAKDEHTWPGMVFVQVPEEKTVKNRLHIDLNPDDQEAEVSRIEGLGARRIDIGQGDVRWVVMADPEGNEFCVLTAREQQP
jgi:predicted enzyme related to lactoylglutathione lyase